MTQLCCYKVWNGSHEKFRRTVLILAFIDLVLISTVITLVAISLYNHASADAPISSEPGIIGPGDDSSIHASDISSSNHEGNGSSGTIVDSGGGGDGTVCGIDDDDCVPGSEVSTLPPNVNNNTAKIFPPPTPYFQVVGYRITKSIQLIIYTCQLFMTVSLIRGLLRTDTLSMRTWLIVTEIITTIIFLVLILYLFGDFKARTVLTMSVYLVYQFILIRTVSRYIRRTEIELTQFGSIVEF